MHERAAARPIAEQARYYDEAVAVVAARRRKKALRAAARAETRMRRRYRTFKDLADKRPDEPTGILAGLRRRGYRAQMDDWQQQYDRVQRLVTQAEATRSAVSEAASHRGASQVAQREVQRQLPKLSARVLALKAEQVRRLLLSLAYAVLGGAGTAVALLPILAVLQAETRAGVPLLWLSLVAFPFGGYFTWRYLNQERADDQRQLLRGAQITGSAAWLRATAKAKQQFGDEVLTLAGIFVQADDEGKHFKILGTTGSGKSTAIRELMTGALKRGDRAVFADPSGDYLQRFYDPGRGDVILNPFDSRSARWDPFGEFSERFEIDQLVRSLIPADDEWSGYARTFVSAVFARCAEAGNRELDEAWRLIAIAPSQELQVLLVGTAAQPFLEEGNVRMFGSIRAVAISALEAMDYVRDRGGVPFSVRRWVREGRGVLFLPYQPEQVAALSTLIACWMRLAIFQKLGLSDGNEPADRDRLWFVIDELDALGRIHGLKDALARLRKAGGRCVIGFQSIAQVSTTYGQGEARTIVENCSNSLILRCSASEGGGTAEFAANLIGQREIVRETVSVSHSGGFLQRRQRSVSFGTEHRVEQAVLPSEIEALPDRSGFLKGASSDSWVTVAF